MILYHEEIYLPLNDVGLLRFLQTFLISFFVHIYNLKSQQSTIPAKEKDFADISY